MKNAEKTFRPKAGRENVAVTFTNPLTGETKDIHSWPYTTESSVEMAFLSAHEWITDQAKPAERKAKKEDS